MKQQEFTWTIQEEEQAGDYFFSGRLYTTAGIQRELHVSEIVEIVWQVKKRVREGNGADYLQVFVNEVGEKIFVIDQLSKTMLAGSGYTEKEKREYNYATILFSYEY